MSRTTEIWSVFQTFFESKVEDATLWLKCFFLADQADHATNLPYLPQYEFPIYPLHRYISKVKDLFLVTRLN